MKKLLFLLMMGVIISTSGVFAQTEEGSQKALTAAKEWLGLLDKGDYDSVWGNGSEYFKQAVSREDSDKFLSAARNPIGAIISREIVSQDYYATLPGAPDGEYYVIVFQSEFENKKLAFETITPKLDSDGVWRVSGYFIR